MNYLIKVLMFLSIGMIIFNTTQVNWKDPFTQKSSIAVIGIMAALCAFLLYCYYLSKKISKKLNR